MISPSSLSRRAELRLHITKEEHLPGDFRDVVRLFQAWGLHRDPQECIWVVAYDSQADVRTVVEIARGSHVRADLHYPTMLAAIMLAGCERFMIVHNHPHGRATPSRGDREMTRDIMNAANLCGLFFEDHVILTPTGKHYSFFEKGAMVPADYALHTRAESA